MPTPSTVDPLSRLSRRRIAWMGGALLVYGLIAAGCATPRAIEGEKIVGTRWVDGKLVYVTAPPTNIELEKIRREADALRELNDATPFEPVRKL